MRQIVSSAFATAERARAVGAGTKTKELVDKVHALLKRYSIKPTAFYVADNLSRLQFKGTFGRNVKAQDVGRFGGLGGKPVVLDVTVSPGRQVWVQVTAWKGKTSISLALPKRDLGTTFAVVQRAVQRLLNDVIATAAVQTFVTKQDERDERDRRRYKGLRLDGDVYSIRNEVEKAGGMWDPGDKAWLLPDEETIKQLAQKHGYMLRHDARRAKWWIDPAVVIEGPPNVTKTLSGELKRHFGRWDGKKWRVPLKRLNDLRATLEKKGVEFDEREGGGGAGLWGVVTLKSLAPPKARQPVSLDAEIDFAKMLLRRLDESGEPFPAALQKYKGPLDRIKRLKQMKRSELLKLHEQVRDALPNRARAFFGRSAPKTAIPSELRHYADMAAPFNGTLFAHAPDRVFFWFETEKERESFRRKHKRHFADQTLYQADRRFYDLKDATPLSRPRTDHLLWAYTL